MIVSFIHEKLYREYRDKVYAYISKRVAIKEDAEDLCEEVFVRLFKMLDSYDEQKASYSTLIYSMSHNIVIDHYRTNKVHEELSEDESYAVIPSAEGVVMDMEQSEEIATALSKLPVEQRDILVLRYYKGYSLKTIAEKMGLTYNMVVSRQKSAFETLKKELQK